MAVDDVYRLTIQASQANNFFMNTYAVRMKSSPDPTDSDIVTLANATMNIARAQQSTSLAYTGWTFSQLWGGGVTVQQDLCRRTPGLQMAGVMSGTVTGALSGETLPPQCAVVWTMLTGYAGRRRRGRSYVFGLTEIQQTGGAWSSSLITAMNSALTTYLGLYGVAGTDPQFQVGVWSERTASGCIPKPKPPGGMQNIETPNPGSAFMRMTGYTVRPIVYTQRRRTLGVGR